MQPVESNLQFFLVPTTVGWTDTLRPFTTELGDSGVLKIFARWAFSSYTTIGLSLKPITEQLFQVPVTPLRWRARYGEVLSCAAVRYGTVKYSSTTTGNAASCIVLYMHDNSTVCSPSHATKVPLRIVAYSIAKGWK